MQIFRFTIALLGLLLPLSANAQVDPSTIDPCMISGLSCAGADGASYIEASLVRPAMIAFTGVLFAMLVVYALKMLIQSHEESAITEARLAFFHTIFGAVLVSGAYLIASSFVLTGSGGVQAEPITSGVLGPIAVFLKSTLSALVVANIAYQGGRLILSRGEEGEMDTARKRLLTGLAGAAIVIISSPLVNTFTGGGIGVATAEIVGIANFLATVFGALAVIAIIVAGIMLVVSVDESLKDKAKQIIIASVVAMAVVISSYALVTLFII